MIHQIFIFEPLTSYTDQGFSDHYGLHPSVIYFDHLKHKSIFFTTLF